MELHESTAIMYSPNKALVAAGFLLGSIDYVLQECSLPSVAVRGRRRFYARIVPVLQECSWPSVAVRHRFYTTTIKRDRKYSSDEKIELVANCIVIESKENSK